MQHSAIPARNDEEDKDYAFQKQSRVLYVQVSCPAAHPDCTSAEIIPRKRRVKCDETKPYCRVCLSGSRICDGYNIVIDVPKRKLREISSLDCKRRTADIQPKPTTTLDSLPSLNPVESRAFERFRSQTIPELAGLRSGEFWRCVVLPACYSEPAILHASLALSCAHIFRAKQKSGPNQPASQDIRIIAIGEYNKAIRSLNERVLKHEYVSSLRVILITCAMFIALELFGGCLEKAMIHLNEGRKLLPQLGLTTNNGSTGAKSENETKALYFVAKPESVEERLVNRFAHLDLQLTYFGSERPQLNLAAHSRTTTLAKDSEIGPDPLISLIIPAYFNSLHEANQYLVILTNECLKFTGCSFDQTQHSIRNHQSNFHRQYLSSCLRNWRQAYGQPSFTTTQLEKSDRSWKSRSALMLIQHAWLSIIISTSFLEVEETELDSLSPHFTTIVNLTCFVLSPEGEGTSVNRKHFALELGIVPPLWWTVMKCRHPKMRRKALWLISRVGSEGFWDPIIMRQTGIETILLEEGQPWKSVALAGSTFSFDQVETIDDDMDLKVFVPSWRRISAVTVSSVNNNQKMLQMTFKRKKRDGDGKWTGVFEEITYKKPLGSFPNWPA
jgi:hypothetical protein